MNFSFSQNSTTYEIEKLPTPKNLIRQDSKQQFLRILNMDMDLESCSSLPDSLINFGENSFLWGLVAAYKEDRPFAISPDMIWLLISQGFARHISFNSEKYRNSIVNFSGKKTLKVEARKYITLHDSTSNWEKVFPQLITQISNYTGAELTSVLTADFSTTTSMSKIVSQITIMEALHGYFKYEIFGKGCGIPRIKIDGTIEDWQKVLEKTQYLSKYDLAWWTDELCKIINEIINAKKGNFDKNFWMNMVKVHSKNEYGSQDSITGWILKFFPYYNDSTRTNFKPLNDISKLPTEYVRVPFTFIDDSLKLKFNMEFRAGFVGFTQNDNDYTLKPEIGWMIGYKKEK